MCKNKFHFCDQMVEIKNLLYHNFKFPIDKSDN